MRRILSAPASLTLVACAFAARPSAPRMEAMLEASGEAGVSRDAQEPDGPGEGGAAVEAGEARSAPALTSAQDAAIRQTREFPDRAAIESLDRLTDFAWSWDREHLSATLTLASDDLFEPGSEALTPRAHFRLDVLAPALAMQFGRTVAVSVYTDSLGDPAQSLALSKRRAEALCRYLAMRGVPEGSLRSAGLGEAHPVGDNATTFGRAANRRVEIIVRRTAARSSD